MKRGANAGSGYVRGILSIYSFSPSGGYRGGSSARGKGRSATTRTSGGNSTTAGQNSRGAVSNRRNNESRGRGGRTGATVPTTLFDLEAATAQFDKESVYQNINEKLSKPEDEQEEEDGVQ